MTGARLNRDGTILLPAMSASWREYADELDLAAFHFAADVFRLIAEAVDNPEEERCRD